MVNTQKIISIQNEYDKLLDKIEKLNERVFELEQLLHKK